MVSSRPRKRKEKGERVGRGEGGESAEAGEEGKEDLTVGIDELLYLTAALVA